ncbi:hypothetical protein HPB47_020663 [Ixodes persulcatus]|uniref:Uncharacterized protein n=1 Tax=Ixodes persulcatus TaxID=34615 RepID=A0AC60QEU3_IXOPE|nr:hypothetical protein HPB47_020663 [Ixodes persulcatus]
MQCKPPWLPASYSLSGTSFSSALSSRRHGVLRLRPTVLRGVAQRQLEVTLLGDQTLSMPIGISPTALHKYAHPDGEAATARGQLAIIPLSQSPDAADTTSASSGLSAFLPSTRARAVQALSRAT